MRCVFVQCSNIFQPTTCPTDAPKHHYNYPVLVISITSNLVHIVIIGASALLTLTFTCDVHCTCFFCVVVLSFAIRIYSVAKCALHAITGLYTLWNKNTPKKKRKEQKLREVEEQQHKYSLRCPFFFNIFSIATALIIVCVFVWYSRFFFLRNSFPPLYKCAFLSVDAYQFRMYSLSKDMAFDKRRTEREREKIEEKRQGKCGCLNRY